MTSLPAARLLTSSMKRIPTSAAAEILGGYAPTMLSVIGPANAMPVDSVKKAPVTRAANTFLLVNNVISWFLLKLMVILYPKTIRRVT